jgi:hypothetical protein
MKLISTLRRWRFTDLKIYLCITSQKWSDVLKPYTSKLVQCGVRMILGHCLLLQLGIRSTVFRRIALSPSPGKGSICSVWLGGRWAYCGSCFERHVEGNSSIAHTDHKFDKYVRPVCCTKSIITYVMLLWTFSTRESINRSQMNIKHKIYDIRTWGKNVFLDISSYRFTSASKSSAYE